MKVIVFGGTGWIGHQIAQEFTKAGFSTVICSRGKNTKFAAETTGIKTIKADKNNPEDVAEIFKESRYDIVVDSVPHTTSIENIFKYAQGLKQYIHCSSVGGYAPLPAIPGDETMPYSGFDNQSGWAAKADCDATVMNLFQSNGFPATVIRPCYITGPGMLPIDNLGGRRQDFISDILAGKTLDLVNDGQALLQPVHCRDLAKSFLLAAVNPKKSISQIYNICLEKAVTIKRYLEINIKVLGGGSEINLMPLDQMMEKYRGDINEIGLRFFATHMCFDISKAKEQLGYFPEHTSVQAIEETALWAKDYLAGCVK